MTNEKNSDAASVDSQQRAPLMSIGRRRLLRGGLGASPVLLTFVSRPAPAVDFATACVSASATISANASGQTGIAPGPGCAGVGPATWNSVSYRPNRWPNGVTPNTLFSDYFQGGGYAAGATFGSVLDEAATLAGDEASKLRRNLVAAVLNNLAGNISPSIYDVSKLQSIWAQLGTSPSATWVVNAAGQTWNAQQTNALWFNAHLFQGAV